MVTSRKTEWCTLLQNYEIIQILEGEVVNASIIYIYIYVYIKHAHNHFKLVSLLKGG